MRLEAVRLPGSCLARAQPLQTFRQSPPRSSCFGPTRRESGCNPVFVSKLSWICQEQALQAQSRTIQARTCFNLACDTDSAVIALLHPFPRPYARTCSSITYDTNSAVIALEHTDSRHYMGLNLFSAFPKPPFVNQCPTTGYASIP